MRPKWTEAGKTSDVKTKRQQKKNQQLQRLSSSAIVSVYPLITNPLPALHETHECLKELYKYLAVRIIQVYVQVLARKYFICGIKNLVSVNNEITHSKTTRV